MVMSSISTVTNRFLRKLFALNIIRVKRKEESSAQDNVILTQENWDYSKDSWYIGGHFKVSNHSRGYHGILQQWWEKYTTGITFY